MFRYLGRFAVLAVCLFAIAMVGCDTDLPITLPIDKPPVEVTQQRFTGTLTVPDSDYVRGLAWNPQGTMLAVGYWGDEPELGVWLYDTATGEYLKNLKGDFGSGVHGLVWGSALFIYSDDNDVQMWDPATGQHLRTIADESSEFAISPDSRIIAVDEWPGLELIDIGTGQVLRTISEEYEWEWFDFDGSSLGKRIGYWSYNGFAFSPDGSTLAVGAFREHPDTYQVHWYDVAKGTKEVEGVRYIGGGPLIEPVAWHSDGSMLVCLSGGEILWLDAVTGQPFGPEDSDDFPYDVLSIASSPTTPSIMAVGDWHGVIELVDFATWQVLKTLTHGDDVDHLAFSPDGKTLASGTESPPLIRLWDVSDVSR